MFDEASDTPTVARTSNLNEELGQVSYCQGYIVLAGTGSDQSLSGFIVLAGTGSGH